MIYYLGWYKSENVDDYTKSANNAGSFKMGYVIRKINQLDKELTVVSCCTSDKKGFANAKEIKVRDNLTEYYLPSLRLNGFLRRFGAIYRKIVLTKFLKKNLTKDDTLIVYHALGIVDIIKKLKKKIGFKLVLEVEEIYHADKHIKDYQKAKKEEQSAIDIADAYIVVNDLIYEKYINNGKPHMVLYGVYDGVDSNKFTELEKNKTHLLFSGSIDRVRGAGLAVETAKYLNGDYVLHISGGGTGEFFNQFKKNIEEHNHNKGVAEIIYHGRLNDDELDRLANSCDIGLNLQDVDNPFEAVSYPSKISFYMLHGLNVVSTKMSSVKASKLGGSVVYTDSKPESVAETIKNIKIVGRKSQISKMQEMDVDVSNSLSQIL